MRLKRTDSKRLETDHIARSMQKEKGVLSVPATVFLKPTGKTALDALKEKGSM